VRQALAGLPEDYQEVIRLRLLLELPTATVAAWMGRKEGAVRVLLHRALLALRARMGSDDGAV
jgi:RNA polymerase sigma factor (sigma-70 family)